MASHVIHFLVELRRRRVYRVGAIYILGSWALLQLLDIVLPTFGIPESAMRYILLGIFLGFPIALVLGWMFQLTPDGLVRTESFANTTGDADLKLHRIDYAILAGLFLVAAVLAYQLASRIVAVPVPPGPLAQSREVPDNSVAVLPFKNLSGDPGREYFTDGISEELLNTLSGISGLHVSARSSSFYFKGKTVPLHEIAQTLSVRTVLEGSVRIAGDNVRITAQLSNAVDGYQMWAGAYDGRLTTENMFEIQREVATEIVRALRSTLSAGERKRLATVPTRRVDAYEAYLLGKEQMARRTIGGLRAAVEQFSRAIALDGEFAMAHVGIANAYILLHDWGHMGRDDVLPLIRESASRALALNDQLGEAHVALATLYDYDHDYAEADAAFRRGLELTPNDATGHSWYGLFLLWRMGRWEEALEEAEKAMALDPLSPLLRINYGGALAAFGRFDEALEQFRKSGELDPSFAFAYKSIGDDYLTTHGRLDEAMRWYRRAIEIEADPSWLADIGAIYLTAGDEESGTRWIERARALEANNLFVHFHLALLNAYQERHDLVRRHGLEFLQGPFDPSATRMLFMLRNADLAERRYKDAQLRYERIFPALARQDPVVHRSNYREAIDLALVLQRLGDHQRASTLLERSLTVARTVPKMGAFGSGVATAEIHALRGDADASLSALRDTVEAGWRVDWPLRTTHNPNFDSIRDDPRFAAITAELESNMNEQLLRIRAMERDGSLAEIRE